MYIGRYFTITREGALEDVTLSYTFAGLVNSDSIRGVAVTLGLPMA